MKNPQKYERSERGGYIGCAVAAKRTFVTPEGEASMREFVIVGPDKETALLVWNHLMNIKCDPKGIYRVALEKAE